MNRILLVPLVTAALAAAGCNSSRCDATDLTFYWRFVGAPVGGSRIATPTNTDNACGSAGIYAIEVTIGGVTDRWPCYDSLGN
ncbi:MAG TPA: hypothetical protein VFK85_03340, partial [Anaeromyxobacteraceae bacterium]|nr:hypothetical protein [Anaeromyxobacteraceae bacterium]